MQSLQKADYLLFLQLVSLNKVEIFCSSCLWASRRLEVSSGCIWYSINKIKNKNQKNYKNKITQIRSSGEADEKKFQILSPREEEQFWNITKVYEGETGRTARLRGAEHLKECEKKVDKGVLYKHKMAEHKNEHVRFKMEITLKFQDALTGQANEAVRIARRSSQELFNSKSEFNRPPV